MAKKVGLDYDQMHFMRIEAYTRKIQQLYLSAIREASLISEGVKLKGEDQFTFDKYPKTKQRIDKLIAGLNTQMYSSIQEMTHNEWLAASYKSDALVDYIKGKTKLPTSLLEKYQSRNLEALSSFQQRKINGLNLSDRVWNYTNQFKGELELGLDIGIGEGKSAAELSRDLRSYLNDPDKLFRRVRDKHGNLVLSKNAKKYNPGPGVYRSSYKNAMRLTRTEVNMAYRASDYERNQQLDFVVGFEVRRSNNIFSCPVCESLKGKYPKTFKFVGWHPQCRCHCIAITSTQEEFIEHEKKLLAGEESDLKSKNEVTDVPDNFKQWISNNQSRIDNAKSKPYFIGDNANAVKLILSKKNAFDVDIAGIINAKTDIEASNELLDFLTKNGVEWKDMGKYMSQSDKKAALVNAYDEFNKAGEYYNVNKYQYESISKRQKLIESDLLQATNSDYGYISTVNYKEINGKLRGVNEFSLYQAEKAQTIKSLDRMIDSNKLPENMMLYRNVDNDFVESIFKVDKSAPIDARLLKIQESIDNGVVISDKGFCSTSCISDMNVFGQRDVFITIKAPKGTNAFVTSNFDESEVILKRDQKFRVTKVTKTTREYRVAARTINKEIIQIELVAL